MKTLTQKEYKKLNSIEIAAQRYAYGLKGPWSDSLKLMYYRRLWKQVAEELGILQPNGDEVKYKVENGRDYSHGYNFGDALA